MRLSFPDGQGHTDKKSQSLSRLSTTGLIKAHERAGKTKDGKDRAPRWALRDEHDLAALRSLTATLWPARDIADAQSVGDARLRSARAA